MEKKLLLLSVLRNHEMHGYQMNEILTQDAGIGITLKKANAYQLLNKMAADGWISYREEKEGNRPPRRVYAIAPAGEVAFQRLLRESLAAYAAPQLPSIIAYNYLDELTTGEALTLLAKRRQQIAKQFEQLETSPAEILQAHLGMVYLHQFYATELAWIDEIVNQLQEKNL
jgi:DNA-binding PadR family transcriptional regulator